MNIENIALFGGSFDPIHLGHVKLLESVMSTLPLDKCIIFPCKQSPHKTNAPLSSDQDRFHMCRLALQHMHNIEVSALELSRTTNPSYSWMTVKLIKEAYPLSKIHWILGTDQWDVIESWENFPYLAENLTFIVITRQSTVSVKPTLDYITHNFDAKISSTQIRRNLRSGKTTSALPLLVHQYIKKNQLYGTTI